MKTTNLLLLMGGAAAAYYFLVKKPLQAAAEIPQQIAQAVTQPPLVIAPWQPVTQPAVELGKDLASSIIEGLAGQQPLRTYEPVPEVRPVLTEATATVPGTSFPVSPQRLAYQEAIGVPIVTPEQLAAPQAAPTGLQYLLETAAAPGGVLAQQPSGQFWVNPLTQERLGAYVPGQTPASVLALREQDIMPAIRSV